MTGERVTMDLSAYSEAHIGLVVDLAMILHFAGIIDARALAAHLTDPANPVAGHNEATRYASKWASEMLLKSVDHDDAKRALQSNDGNTGGKPRLTLVPLDGEPS